MLQNNTLEILTLGGWSRVGCETISGDITQPTDPSSGTIK